MNYGSPGFSVHHYLPEFAQSHPSSWWCHPNISSSVVPFSSCPHFFPQQQGLFQWVSSSYHVAKLLELQLQYQSFQWIFRTDFISDELVGSPCSPRESQESSSNAVQKHKFFSAHLLYGPTLLSEHDYWKNHSFDYTDLCWQRDVSAF